MGHPNISYNIYIMDDSQNWVDELQYSTPVVCLLPPWFSLSRKKPSKNIHPDTFGSYWMCSRWADQVDSSVEILQEIDMK